METQCPVTWAAATPHTTYRLTCALALPPRPWCRSASCIRAAREITYRHSRSYIRDVKLRARNRYAPNSCLECEIGSECL
jgi:hypothetical protein